MKDKKGSVDVERIIESQRIVTSILSLASEELSLDDALQKIMDLLLKIPWLPRARIGAIFLRDGENLRMVANGGMPQKIVERCKVIMAGECLCGLTLEKGEVLFVNCLDERHTIRFEDTHDHGHYCLPLRANNRVIGVINLYLESGHPYDPVEEALLESVATAVAGVISHIQLRDQERKLSLAIDQVPDWVVMTDRDGVIQYANRAVEEITGCSLKEVIGSKPNIWKSGLHDKAFYKRLWDTVLRGKPFRAVFINRKKNGELFYLDQTITPIKGSDGEIKGFVATGKDVTESKKYQEKIYKLAYYDPLTGIPNRNYFMEEGARMLRKNRDSSFYMIVVDIDRFKFVNDVYGAKLSDELLRWVADSLREELGEEALISRLGSDEFGVLVRGQGSDKRASVVARRLLRRISQPVVIDGRQVAITISAGVSLYPDHGRTMSELLRSADIALTHAKEEGKNTFALFRSDMNLRVRETISITKDIVGSCARKDFELRFQPIVDASTGKVMAYEVLSRWKKKNVSPARFIPVLEETGLINELSLWIVEESLSMLELMQRDLGYSLSVSINVSPLNLKSQKFVNRVTSLFRSVSVPDGAVIFEITENVLLSEEEGIRKALLQLRDQGVAFAIDDFGAGHTSLHYLRRYPIDFVKFDSAFLRGIEKDVRNKALLESLIYTMRRMEKWTVAEGVERKEQLRILQSFGCDLCQGFYFYKPMKKDELFGLLRELGE